MRANSKNCTLSLWVIQVFRRDQSRVVLRSAATKTIWFVLNWRRGLLEEPWNKRRCLVFWLSMHAVIWESALYGFHAVNFDRWEGYPDVFWYYRVCFHFDQFGGGRKLSQPLIWRLYNICCIRDLRLFLVWTFRCFVCNIWSINFRFGKIFDSFFQIRLHIVPWSALSLELFEQIML